MHKPSPTGQRALQTRTAILDALVGLLNDQRYETIRIADLVAAAGIGRATFYEHFRSKNDVLLSAIEPVLLALATAASGHAARTYVNRMISHLWEQRALGRTMFNATTGPIVRRQLAEMIRPHVERAAPADPASALRAAGIAAAQITMLQSWLTGEASATADVMTDHIIACAKLRA